MTVGLAQRLAWAVCVLVALAGLVAPLAGAVLAGVGVVVIGLLALCAKDLGRSS